MNAFKLEQQNIIPPLKENDFSPEVLAKKVSLLMTKPENTDTKAPLLLFLKNNGLEGKAFRFTLNEEMLKGLYPNILDLPEIWQATKDHMLGKEVEVFLVTKDKDNFSEDGVVDELVELVGDKTIPEENLDGTLRKHMSGVVKTYPQASGKDILYYENGFHRPVNIKELINNLKVFGLTEEVKKLI